VAGIALRAAWRAGLPEVIDELRKKLASDESDTRNAATAILAETGAGALQAEVSAIVVDPERRRGYPLTRLYEALMRNGDPSVAEVLRRSLETIAPLEETEFANAVLYSGSRAPWLRALLLDLARREGSMKWSAFGRLCDWGVAAPTSELVAICADFLGRPHARADRQPCFEFLGALAGRKLGLDDIAAARDIIAEWVANA
jgi:hypothetical protein